MAKKNELGYYVFPRRWNSTTLMCYNRGCVCGGCEMAVLMRNDNRCQVKASVLESVRVLGAPFERPNSIIEVVMSK